MALELGKLAPRYQRILDSCEPFVVSFRGNWPHLDLKPFGLEIPEERRFCPTSLKSREVVDGLHYLDSFSFGPQEMLMPRWVLFDCGEFPGFVFGFGRRAGALPKRVREAYRVVDRDDVFVPLSMWVAIHCVEPGAFFGHNLSSANLVMGDGPLEGLGTITKAFGMRLCRVRRQYGATQWMSSSLNIHLTYGDMELFSAYTPAHTHIETFSYLINVDDDRLARCLQPGWKRPVAPVDRSFAGDDSAAIRALHDDIERGARFQLTRVERRENASQLLHLRRAP